MNLEKEIFELSLADIMPNRFQPREIFEDESLKELSESIKQHGVIQPIIVRKVGDKYEIIAGERRYRASKLAGIKTIPALVRNIDDKEAAKVALLENLQRQDLSPIEEAKTYQTILKLDNLTQDELAKNLGKSQSAVANKLRLLNLEEDVQTALLNNEISERHARSLLPLDQEKQKELLDKIINERLTVKQLDDEIEKSEGSNNYEEEPVQPIEQKEEKEPEEIETDDIVPQRNNIFDRLRVENQNIEEKEPISEEKEEIIETESQHQEPRLEIQDEFSKIDQLIEETIDDASGKDENKEEKTEKEEKSEEKTPETEPEPIEQKEEAEKYDLRFAINNFRQAIQNTEKFGFKVKTEEFENKENYQLIVTIQKKDNKS